MAPSDAQTAPTPRVPRQRTQLAPGRAYTLREIEAADPRLAAMVREQLGWSRDGRSRRR